MAADRMADSSRPEMMAGKIFRVMVMKTMEESAISPRNMRPTTPDSTDMIRMMVVQEMPMTLDLRSSFSDFRDRKRMMMWGMPK